MRTTFLAIFAALPLLGAAPKPAIEPLDRFGMPLAERAECPEPEVRVVQGDRLKPQKLSELPPARHELAIWHTVDGCTVPVYASDRRYGAPAPKAERKR